MGVGNRNGHLYAGPCVRPTRVSGAAVPTAGDSINYKFDVPVAPCYVSVNNIDVPAFVRINSFAQDVAHVGDFGWTTNAPTDVAGGEADDETYDIILRPNTQETIDISNGGAQSVQTFSLHVLTGGSATTIAEIEASGVPA